VSTVSMRWPGDPSRAPATRGTAKAGKPHCDLAEKRSDDMVLIVLHAASAATAGAGWSPSGAISDLCRDDLLLEVRLQPLHLGQGQPSLACSVAQVGVIARSPSRLISITSVAGPSPSAPIFTTLTIQATRPRPAKEPTQKYPFGAHTPKFGAVPPIRPQ
jgi:hypothetical protein